MQSIEDFLNKSKESKVSICCVGDCLIDEYYSVKVTRVSPEFPVQVMQSKNQKPVETAPGGVANVCNQTRNFNCDTYLVSFLDGYAREKFSAYAFNINYSVDLEYGFVPVKKRYYDGGFALPRHDVEDEHYGEPEETIYKLRDKLKQNFRKLAHDVRLDAVILSDYGKGVFSSVFAQEIIQLCNERGIPTIVDPKDHPLLRWRNCTVFKPNLSGAKHLSNVGEMRLKMHEQLAYFKRELNCRDVLITDSGNGVYISDRVSIPRQKHKQPFVHSVVGAGDCFGAFLAMAISRGFDIVESTEIAFEAGSVYVEAPHNQPITPYKLSCWNDPITTKVVSVEELKVIKNQLGGSWVWTNGCFDILHAQHLKLINHAKTLGDYLVVGINTDESVKRLKGQGRPINNQRDRAYLLSNVKEVDFVVTFNEDTPHAVIDALRPHKICKGGDYAPETVVGADVVGVDNVNIFPYVEGYSTSNVLEKIS